MTAKFLIFLVLLAVGFFIVGFAFTVFGKSDMPPMPAPFNGIAIVLLVIAPSVVAGILAGSWALKQLAGP